MVSCSILFSPPQLSLTLEQWCRIREWFQFHSPSNQNRLITTTTTIIHQTKRMNRMRKLHSEGIISIDHRPPNGQCVHDVIHYDRLVHITVESVNDVYAKWIIIVHGWTIVSANAIRNGSFNSFSTSACPAYIRYLFYVCVGCIMMHTVRRASRVHLERIFIMLK